jgi:hypothetical protein
MTIEELEERLKQLDEMMKQTIANYNMFEGGRNEIQYWINQLKEKSGDGAVKD